MPLLPYIAGLYPVALGYLLQGLALAERIRTAAPENQQVLLAELDSCRTWLDARAVDAPANFRHLATLLTAERARAVGDQGAAAWAFDSAW